MNIDRRYRGERKWFYVYTKVKKKKEKVGLCFK